MELTTKSILITGAAGRIGSATARLAVAAGAEVILTDISNERLRTLKNQLEKFSTANIWTIQCNITVEEELDELLTQAKIYSPKITSAVHCAYPISSGWGTKFGDLKATHLNQDLAMQLGGAILFSQKVLGLFSNQGGGDLVHISSIQGVQSPKFEHYDGTTMSSPIEYAAIKSGIISITKWLAKYHHDLNIRVNCVSPGGILDKQPKIFLERYRKSCANIGMLSSDQVASAILFLLSPAAAAINGHNLIVDDGWSL